MKNNTFLLFIFSTFFSCHAIDKKVEKTDLVIAVKPTIYMHIRKIAEALPMDSKEALDFFADLDSVKGKSHRSNQSQQFQYNTYTLFYMQPKKTNLLKSISMDLDTSSHVDMEELAGKLNATWHSVDLIEIKAGKIHYSTEYVDSKKMKKYIHITISLSSLSNNQGKEISFININSEQN